MKIKLKSTCTSAELNKSDVPTLRNQALLGVAVLTCLTGCVGYVGGGYDAGVVVPVPGVVVVGPEVGFFGGYDRGHDVREDSHRGSESRGEAHGRRR
jgi:hypothetical protein